jgi:hypothetical protein
MTKIGLTKLSIGHVYAKFQPLIIWQQPENEIGNLV